MNARTKFLMVSRERPIHRGESLTRRPPKRKETRGRKIQRLLLPLTLVLVVAVFSLLHPAPASATEMLDQSQPGSQTSHTVGYDTLAAQIFTAGVTGDITRISLRLPAR